VFINGNLDLHLWLYLLISQGQCLLFRLRLHLNQADDFTAWIWPTVELRKKNGYEWADICPKRARRDLNADSIVFIGTIIVLNELYCPPTWKLHRMVCRCKSFFSWLFGIHDILIYWLSSPACALSNHLISLVPWSSWGIYRRCGIFCPTVPLINTCDLRKNSLILIVNPFRMTSGVSLEDFHDFVSALQDKLIKVNDRVRGLSHLSKAFGIHVSFREDISSWTIYDDFANRRSVVILSSISIVSKSSVEECNELRSVNVEPRSILARIHVFAFCSTRLQSSVIPSSFQMVSNHS
jgi:hypothetical protein